jgi:hypothetical protein
MPRVVRPLQTTRSEHWLRRAVNECPEYLNTKISTALGFSASEKIVWRSPIRDDDYAEYRDQEFLDRLDLPPLAVPLRSFWPSGGPRWDGLARTSSGKCILVEAKAYIEEAVDYRSHATDENSLKQISMSLAQAKEAFGATKDAPWNSPLYQHTNRLAHLYYLKGLNDIDTYMVFVYFANAPDVPNPCTPEEWHGAIRFARKCLGLQDNKLSRRIAELTLGVQDLLAAIERVESV